MQQQSTSVNLNADAVVVITSKPAIHGTTEAVKLTQLHVVSGLSMLAIDSQTTAECNDATGTGDHMFVIVWFQPSN